ncbi:hypothetical protein TrVE_jg391 [Triparma verrucosa]|uniref:TNFR-Cys domain-containing protein n=1 Tax=Triparma verrucosa TaxID=1606542 RepID=A0A9W7CGW2_9STRA|nr:hypothetical protein TrVE_jg391 [Triparma verrucosa]
MEDALRTRHSQQMCEPGFACVGGVKTSCEAGLTYQAESGRASCRQCSQCGPGKYIAEECSTVADRQCEECPIGHASLGGLTECDECEAGTPADVGSSVCTPCPQYEEQDVALGYDLDSCVCKPTFVRDPTTNKCSCEPGFTLTGETCSPCEIGRFKDDYGVHSCSRCEDVLKGSVTKFENSTDVGACTCPKGTYDNMEKSCIDVFEGVDRTVSGMTLETLEVEPGYWRTNLHSPDVRECLVAIACAGGNTTNYCREGHTGPYCEICTDSYAKDAFLLCQSCDTTATSVALSILLTVTVGAIIVGGFIYVTKKKEFYKRVKNGGKIIFAALQITSSLPAAIPAMPLPKTFKEADLETREKDEELNDIVFLFEPYKPEFWYFEVVETVRRLLMTGVLSIIKPGTYSQLSYGLFLSIFFTVLLAALQPYNEVRDNRIAVLSSALLIAVFMMSSFKKYTQSLTDEDNTYDDSLMDSLLMMIYIMVLVMFGVWAYYKKDDMSKSTNAMASDVLKGKSNVQSNAGVDERGSVELSTINSSQTVLVGVGGTLTNKLEVTNPFNKGMDERRLKQLESFGPKEKVGKGGKRSKNKDNKAKSKETSETIAPQQKPSAKRKSSIILPPPPSENE